MIEMDDNLDENRNALEGWTKDEKYELLTALKTNRMRSHRIMHIKTRIPTKSSEQIAAALNYFTNRAKKHKAILEGKNFIKMTTLRSHPKIPLAAWANLLTDTFSFEQLQTDTSAAIRLIANIENIPSPAYTEGIDFRKVYHQIANAMEGKGLIGNKKINATLRKCIVDTAFTSKAFMRQSTLKMLLNSLNLNEKEPSSNLPSYSDDTELSLMRKLALQTSYNPLNIPETYLEPTIRKSTDLSP